MSQIPMFDMDTMPEAAPAEKLADKRRWYISVTTSDGKEWTVIATHDEYPEWRAIGTFKHQPLLYRTSAGAMRRGHKYVKPGVTVNVKEWKGWSE